MSRSAGTAIAVGLVAAAIGLGATVYPAGVASLVAMSTGGSVETPTAPSAAPKAARPVVVLVTGPKRGTGGSRSPGGTSGNAATKHARPATSAVPLCASSDRQRDVETALRSLEPYRGVTVDGRQSPDDCIIIRRFQRRFGIEPANGQADATTADVAQRIAASSTPSNLRRCDPGPGVTACVDLSRQTAWVVRDGSVVVGPTVVRTGFRGHPTPTGTYKINLRALREWSDPYSVWLPYWQRFNGGIGLHQTTTYIHDGSLGSHGCVNLLPADAVDMWNQLTLGATVRVVGHRPGT